MGRYSLALLVLLALGLPAMGRPTRMALGQSNPATPTTTPRRPQISARLPTGVPGAAPAARANRAASGDGEWQPTVVAPSPRILHTAVWDPSNNQMLIFGGKSLYSGAAMN